MLKAQYLGRKNLTKEDLDYLGMDFGGPDEDYDMYLKVTHGDAIVSIHRDGGEPEDASFSRDYSWVASLVQKAYKLGLQDGAENKL